MARDEFTGGKDRFGEIFGSDGKIDPSLLPSADSASVTNEAPLDPTHADSGGAIPDGRDNTTALQTALAKLTASSVVNGAMYLRGGDWRWDNLVAGDGTHPLNLKIVGDGPASKIQPYTNGAACLTLNGTLTTDSLILDDLLFTQAADRAYDNPLVKLYKLRDFDINVKSSIADFTGKIFLLDTSYNGRLRLRGNTGRYAIPVDIGSTLSQNIDTLEIDIPANTASMPIFIRPVSGSTRRIWVRMKHAIGFPDFGSYYESTLAAGTSAAAMSLTVPAGAGAGVGAGDPVIVGLPGVADANKVLSVSAGTGPGGTDVINLVQPLLNAHNSSDPVIFHGAHLVAGDNFNIDVDMHAEGVPIGAMIEGGRGYHFKGNNSAGEFVRQYGTGQDHTFGKVVSGGMGDGTPGKPRRNVLCQLASGATIQRPRIEGPFLDPSGAPTKIVLGGDWSGVGGEELRVNSGFLERVKRFASSATLTTKFYRVLVGLKERLALAADGGLWWTPASGNELVAPTLTSATPSGSGGSFGAAANAGYPVGTYYYVLTATNAQGETTQSSEVSATVAAGTTGSVALAFTLPTGATGGRLYRSTVSGDYSKAAFFVVSGTSFTDTGATGSTAPTNGTPPTINSATWPDTTIGRSSGGQIQVGQYDASGARQRGVNVGTNGNTRAAVSFLSSSATLAQIEAWNTHDLRTTTGDRFTATGGIVTLAIGDTTGKTSAQVDTMVATAQGTGAPAAADGLIVYDTVRLIALIRIGGKWQLLTMGTPLS